MFEIYCSSSESADNDSDSNRSGYASSLCAEIDDSHLIIDSLYENRITNFGQLKHK